MRSLVIKNRSLTALSCV